jgi:hypothetical protein
MDGWREREKERLGKRESERNAGRRVGGIEADLVLFA